MFYTQYAESMDMKQYRHQIQFYSVQTLYQKKYVRRTWKSLNT